MATDQLDRIIQLSEFSGVFNDLKHVDLTQGYTIEKALWECLKATCQGLSEAQDDKAALRYWLYRHSVELKAHASSYLSYSEMMATREAALWKFTLNITEQFFQLVFDALEEYFEAKTKIMIQGVEEDSSWYVDLRDTAKKAGAAVNYAKQLLKAAAEAVDLGDTLTDEELVDTKSAVEKVLDTHLSAQQVSQDVAQIMGEASKRYRETWEKEIKAQTPDVEKIRIFAAGDAEKVQPTIAFELGAAEQIFAAGVGVAIMGTIGLAAGWHTLTYALLHVFPPAAIFAVLATVGVVWLSQDKVREKREQQVREAVNHYHRALLLQIDTGKIPVLGNKTLREAMTEQGRTLVSETVKQWEKVISGNLTVEHYRMLISAIHAHLTLVETSLKELEEAP